MPEKLIVQHVNRIQHLKTRREAMCMFKNCVATLNQIVYLASLIDPFRVGQVIIDDLIASFVLKFCIAYANRQM